MFFLIVEPGDSVFQVVVIPICLLSQEYYVRNYVHFNLSFYLWARAQLDMYGLENRFLQIINFFYNQELQCSQKCRVRTCKEQ